MTKKNNFTVTLGYQAVLRVEVKAESAEEAETKARTLAESATARLCVNSTSIDYDNLQVSGLNNDTISWERVKD